MHPSSIPLGNSVYSFTTKHNTLSSTGAIFSVGDGTSYYGSLYLRRSSSSYSSSWYQSSSSFGTYAPGNVVTETYDQSYRRDYVNSQLLTTTLSNNRVGAYGGAAYLGNTNVATTFQMNGELYYLFISSMVLSEPDRLVLELSMTSFPSYRPSALPTAGAKEISLFFNRDIDSCYPPPS